MAPTAIAADVARRPLTVLSYNIHFGVGPGSDQPAAWPTRSAVERHLDGIAAVAREQQVDVLCLQEADLDARRSGRIDQVAFLAEATGLPYRAVAPVWDAAYVPYPYWPPRRHMGRVKSAIAIVSRWPLARHTRHVLPKPEENPFFYNWFYLDRAVQRVDVLAPDGPLAIYNLHLEAFAAGTRMRQARLLVELVRRMEQAQPAAASLLCGDFNALPPDATQRHGFADEPDNDLRGDRTMELIRAGLPGFVDPLDRGLTSAPEQASFTFPAVAPTRRLDYILLGPALVAEQAAVLTGQLHSDHLPVLVRLRRAD